MKSCFIPLCPTWDVNHAIVQHIHAIYTTHTSSIEKKKTHSIYRIGFSTRLWGATIFEWGEDNGKIGTMATLLSLELQKLGKRSPSRSKLSE